MEIRVDFIMLRVNLNTCIQTIRSSWLWIAVISAPLLINGFIWTVMIAPQKNQLAEWRKVQVIMELKPQLQVLTDEGAALISEWPITLFDHEDKSAVTQTIQQLARQHRVTIHELGMRNKQVAKRIATQNTRTASNKEGSKLNESTAPFSVEVSGNYGKLAHWLSAIEAQPGLRIENWVVTSDENSNEHKAQVNITAIFTKNINI